MCDRPTVAKTTPIQTTMLNWLNSSNLEVFATVSLKQAISETHQVFWKDEQWRELSPVHFDSTLAKVNACAGWRRITNEDIRRTAWLLRDRVGRALFGRACRHKRFLTFHHDGNGSKRHHLHIVSEKPSGMMLIDIAERFREASSKLDWVYDQQDIRAIEIGTSRAVLEYSLRDGSRALCDAFMPEASFVPAS